MNDGSSSDTPTLALLPARPRDGPATVFEVDTVMTEILAWQRTNDFGLVLVVGWPPNVHEMEQPYKELVNAMRSCFDDADYERNAYFYPLDSLHITVATLHAFTLETSDAKERAILKQEWQRVLVAASRRPEWPKQPLKLEIDSCQIGSRAGIVLWKETTGGLERMRSCIQQETLQRQEQLQQAGISVNTLRIPAIVHSTVLRFTNPIITDGQVVQERFRRNVLPRLSGIFNKPITATTAVLVCERTPYLHHPYDDRHAIKVIELCKEA